MIVNDVMNITYFITLYDCYTINGVVYKYDRWVKIGAILYINHIPSYLSFYILIN